MGVSDPVVIVGGGLSGAAAAWSLTRRGVPVVLLEQFEPGHRLGSSHGSARIVRRAYGDGLYVRLTGEAFELWREIEVAAGSPLLRMLGGLDFGTPERVTRVAGLLADAGVPYEVLPPGEASGRWPGMSFDEDVLFHPQAGTLNSAGAVTAMLQLAVRAGADVRHRTKAATVTGTRVEPVEGEAIAARAVVVAAGGWVTPLLAGGVQLPELRVTQQQVFHFPRRDADAAPWPSVIHDRPGNPIYHLAGGRDGGPGDDRKIGEHLGGRSTTADARDGLVDPESRARVIRYVEEWLPGLEPTPRGEVTCLYTDTPSQDFLIDRVGDLVVCSPCSGHGAKFAPVVGEMVADLVTGAGAVPDRFRIAAQLSGRVGSVSL
jgi:glycine/D-amino acid oxidase-like deaminating enzyme